VQGASSRASTKRAPKLRYGVGDYKDTLSSVFVASGFRTILSLATQLSMFTDHVDISQAFVQED